jgi:hypothetical protein
MLKIEYEGHGLEDILLKPFLNHFDRFRLS